MDHDTPESPKQELEDSSAGREESIGGEDAQNLVSENALGQDAKIEAGSDSPPRSAGWKPLLKRTDQAFVATVMLVAFVTFGAYWYQQSRRAGGLIEIDRAPRGQAAFQVDLNRATWPEFAQLPGIGETLARRIVESRETDGPFMSLEEVQRVKGIGPRTLERLRPYLLPMAESGTVVGSPLLLEYE